MHKIVFETDKSKYVLSRYFVGFACTETILEKLELAYALVERMLLTR